MEMTEIKEKIKKMVPEFAQKIIPFYQQLQWKWEPEGKAPHIPTCEEIEKQFYSLIDDLRSGVEGDRTITADTVGSGGIEVYYVMPDLETREAGEYGVRFVLEAQEFFN